MALIDIKKYDFDIDIELRYAKKNNITGRKIFVEEKCLLIKEAAEKLFLASKIAKTFDCKLKIFDAYRPKYVQEVLWNFCPNADFLTDPERGSPQKFYSASGLDNLRSRFGDNMGDIRLSSGTFFGYDGVNPTTVSRPPAPTKESERKSEVSKFEGRTSSYAGAFHMISGVKNNTTRYVEGSI